LKNKKYKYYFYKLIKKFLCHCFAKIPFPKNETEELIFLVRDYIPFVYNNSTRKNINKFPKK